MSITTLPNGKHAVRWRSGGKQRSKTFTRLSDAQRFDVDTRRRLELGDLVLSKADVPLLRDEAESWLASKLDLSPTTEALYARYLSDYILPELGGLRLSELRPRRLEAWQRGLMAHSGTRAVQMARGVLSQILDRAVAHEYIPSNGLKSVKGPQHRTRVVEPASVEQVEVMRGTLEAPEKALISLLAYVGLRPPQEPMALMWSDLAGPRLRLRRRNVFGEIKAGLKQGVRERVVDLPGPVAQELAELRIRQGRPTGLIFARSDGQPWAKTDWDNWRARAFKKARDAAQLPNTFTPYDLRHSAASLMLAAGRPLPEVAYHLGHSIQVCAGTYAHVIDTYRGQEIVSVERRINNARSVAKVGVL